MSKGNRIQLDILDIDLEHKHRSTCTFDFIQIFDGERTTDKSIGKTTLLKLLDLLYFTPIWTIEGKGKGKSTLHF